MVSLSVGKVSDLWRARRIAQAERRGDVVDGWSDSLKFFLELAGDLIPEAEREIPRDLLGLLAYAWAARADRNAAYDPHALLGEIRARAWLGYADTPVLVAQIRADLARSDTGRRMAAFFEELASKRSAYLFLPVVSRIDQHQSGAGPLAEGALRLDGLAQRYAHLTLSEFATVSFAMAPQLTRERDAFLLALLLDGWSGERFATQTELSTGAAVQLRRLYEDPSGALATVRADFPELGATGEFAHELAGAAEEVCVATPWLWLETLFIVENWNAGQQWFDHAFEVEEVSRQTWLTDNPGGGTEGGFRSTRSR